MYVLRLRSHANLVGLGILQSNISCILTHLGQQPSSLLFQYKLIAFAAKVAVECSLMSDQAIQQHVRPHQWDLVHRHHGHKHAPTATPQVIKLNHPPQEE